MKSVRHSRPDLRASVALVVASLALILAVYGLWFRNVNADIRPKGTDEVPGLLQRIETTNELHAGYGVYPPYTQEDPTSKAVSGFSVELLEAVARDLQSKIVWHRLNWNTMAADLKRGEFDVIADPIFQTIPRAREFAFTEPYAYFADGIGVVRQNETRFTDFASIDQRGITVAVGQGWASETLLRVRLSNATLKPIQTSTDLLQVFNEVISSRADIAVADAADALRYVSEHQGEVKALWTDNPPAFMPAGFALRPTDKAGAEFLTVAMRNLKATGVVDALAAKYKVDTIRPGLK